jgi:hypothetical protein
MQEFGIGELALARQTGVIATWNALADVLDLQHRLPRVWRQVTDLRCDAWVARKVASLSRSLPIEKVGLVDAAVADAIGTESPGRVLKLAEAKVIEADPRAHADKLAAEAHRRYVAVTKSDEAGLRTIIAKINGGDAVWVMATVNRAADLLAPLHPDLTRDELRALAFGLLARPAELLALLLTGADTSDAETSDAETSDAETTGDESERPDPEPWEPGAEPDPDEEPEVEPSVTEWLPDDVPWLPDLEPDLDPEPLPETPQPGWSRATAFPADLLDRLSAIDPRQLRPQAVLYVHLHEAVAAGLVPGVARVEDGGPLLPDQLRQWLGQWLGHPMVKVQPVIDLNDDIQVSAYEHPEALKERIWLTSRGDVFPYSSGSETRRVDYDHPTPYDPNGPPGQTGTHNSGPLGRRHHRWKTHAGYQARQIGPATYLWRTPHGRYYLVDSHGTHEVDPTAGAAVMAGPTQTHPGVYSLR